ncbi:hypothetical protein WJX77_000474 [Trebouxia sp. C0004]
MAVVQYDSPLNVAQAKQALLEEHRSWIGPLQAEGSSKRVGGDQQLTPGLSYIRTLQRQNEEDHISINGAWLSSHPHIVTAVDLDKGSLLALKLLPPASQEEKDAAQSEKRAQAVTAMHEVNLLHTDFKAANVFVDSSGAWFMGDIGASNLFGDESGSVQRLCTQAISNFSKQITSMIAAC